VLRGQLLMIQGRDAVIAMAVRNFFSSAKTTTKTHVALSSAAQRLHGGAATWIRQEIELPFSWRSFSKSNGLGLSLCPIIKR